jgi:hypothetical protein
VLCDDLARYRKNKPSWSVVSLARLAVKIHDQANKVICDPCLKKDQSVSGYILFLQCCGSGITKGIFTLLRYQGIKRIMVQVVASRAPKSEFVNSF